MSTGLAVFDQTVQETNVWLKEVEALMFPCSRQDAYAAWRAVMHALRDHLPPEENLHLSAQLPMLLRGVFLEGWSWAARPKRERTTEAFVERVCRELPPNFDWHPEFVARAVFETVTHRVEFGEVADIIGRLPASLRDLWPPGAVALSLGIRA